LALELHFALFNSFDFLECLKKLKKDERQSIIMFDVLIIGGGVSGISCALVLGSAKIKILQ
jgi:heterodisulfide reductase subunit A-like polyferredoxin